MYMLATCYLIEIYFIKTVLTKSVGGIYKNKTV